MIHGGADADLRDLVRGRLRTGSLKPATWRCWPVPATGQPCLACAKPIFEPDVDYEIGSAPPTHAHLDCYEVWVEESKVLQSASKTVALKSQVRLRSDPETIGTVVATRDGGQWIYVAWKRRTGCEGTVTAESSADLQPLDDRWGARR